MFILNLFKFFLTDSLLFLKWVKQKTLFISYSQTIVKLKIINRYQFRFNLFIITKSKKNLFYFFS